MLHKAMSALLHPGRVVALARAANPATWNHPMPTDYAALVTDFLGLLERRQIPFVVVGGIALLRHVEGRNTEDIDLILSAPSLAGIPELLVRERTAMFAYGHYQELRVDVLLAEHPLFARVAREFAAPMDYQVGKLPTATIDGLILLKLFALPSLYRQFDYDRVAIYEADLTQLLARSLRDDAFLLEILAPYLLDSDRQELAEILDDIRRRLHRMRKG
jgi:hypothetical protein